MEDEALVQAAKKISPSERLVIFDARSILAAGGNRLKVSYIVGDRLIRNRVVSDCLVAYEIPSLPDFLSGLKCGHVLQVIIICRLGLSFG